jgi:GAF domain-containing protein
MTKSVLDVTRSNALAVTDAVLNEAVVSDVWDDVDDQVWPVLEQLARAMRVSDAELDPTLTAVVGMAVDTIGPADYAGLVLVISKAVEPMVVAGEPVRILDEWQQLEKIGPCIDAAEQQQLVTIPDTRSEQRWEGFGARAASVGVLSMICLPLYVGRERLGSLSLYSGRPGAFTQQHERVAALFATHAALALAEARRLEHVRTALSSRQLIGQATGILMERHRLTADAAFSQLVTASQNLNHKLVVVAEHLIETGELADRTTQLYRAPGS